MENTLASFDRAVADGADGVEFDVRLCASGEVVVFHDDDLSRLAGRPERIDALTLAELGNVSIQGHRIPTLDDALDGLPETLINIEIKSTRLGGGWQLTERTIQMVRRHGASDRVLLSSFDPSALLQARLRARDIPTGLLFHRKLARPLREAWPAHLVRPFALHPECVLVTPDLVRAWRRRGLRINVWTVDDPVELRRLHSLGVDGIFTNDPAAARRALWRFNGEGRQ